MTNPPTPEAARMRETRTETETTRVDRCAFCTVPFSQHPEIDGSRWCPSQIPAPVPDTEGDEA